MKSLLLLALLLLLPACSAEQANKTLAEIQTIAVAEMEADGLDPSVATPEQVRAYMAEAAQAWALQHGEIPEDGTLPVWLVLLLKSAGILIGGNVGLGLFSSRGQANIANVKNPDSSWKSTRSSIYALALPLKSPPEAEAIATAARAAAKKAA